MQRSSCTPSRGAYWSTGGRFLFFSCEQGGDAPRQRLPTPLDSSGAHHPVTVQHRALHAEVLRGLSLPPSRHVHAVGRGVPGISCHRFTPSLSASWIRRPFQCRIYPPRRGSVPHREAAGTRGRSCAAPGPGVRDGRRLREDVDLPEGCAGTHVTSSRASVGGVDRRASPVHKGDLSLGVSRDAARPSGSHAGFAVDEGGGSHSP